MLIGAIGGTEFRSNRDVIVAADHNFADFRNTVLESTNIVELIGQTVALKKRGNRYVGLCPFHQERTPSFHVNPDRRMYYCFGCKASGTAIDFVMHRDRVEFLDALRQLAETAGLDMPSRSGDGSERSQRQQMLQANSAACSFFENQLLQTEEGKPALAYLHKRGFSDDTIRSFRLGLAPDRWDGLLAGDVGNKFDRETLLSSGLIKPRNNGNGHYDAFRARIIFPILNESGQIIAFGGRIMPGSKDPAKYLNSPETPLFSKSRCAFGLNQARDAIVQSQSVAIVEGYTDVLMAHQHGVGNVVSVLGTAFTAQHAALLKRFAQRVVLLFDADAAGEAAVDRALELLLSQQLDIAIASLPDGVDPDEYVLAHGADGFRKLLDNAPDALSFKWKHLQRRFEATGSMTDRQQALDLYLDALGRAKAAGPVDSIRWGQALASVSRMTLIPVEDLRQRLRVDQAKNRSRNVSQPAQPHIQGEPTNEPTANIPSGPTEVVERLIIGILVEEPELWMSVQHLLSPQSFLIDPYRTLADSVWQRQRDIGPEVLSEILPEMPADLRPLMLDAADVASQILDRAQALNDAIRELDRLRTIEAARRQQAELEQAGTEDEQIALLRRLQEQAERMRGKPSTNAET